LQSKWILRIREREKKMNLIELNWIGNGEEKINEISMCTEKEKEKEKETLLCSNGYFWCE